MSKKEKAKAEPKPEEDRGALDFSGLEKAEKSPSRKRGKR